MPTILLVKKLQLVKAISLSFSHEKHVELNHTCTKVITGLMVYSR